MTNNLVKIVNLNDFKLDLDNAEKSGDIRMLLLYSNLYNEHFIDLLYQKYFLKDKLETCDKCNKLLIPKFKQQVKQLSEINIVDIKNKHDNIINLIFDLRNELAHKLSYNIKELEQRFNEFKPKDDRTGIITKFLNSASSWEKIKLAVFATVTGLYHKYEESFDRTPEQTIHFEINPTGTEVRVVIKAY